jgi:dienelactone hydrolase
VTALTTNSLHYSDDGTELIGYFVHLLGTPQPGVLLIHDAFGVSEPMKATAHRIAALGYSVLLIDLWGEGRTPSGEDEIGPLIGSLVSNRERWVGRIRAGHNALLAQADVGDGPITAVGYCFGGSSALEYLRHGGELAGVVSFHGGLDTVGSDWSAGFSDAKVLVLTGAEDPMAPKGVVDALQAGLTAAGIDWEVAVYGGTKHAFTDIHADRAGRPEAIAYDARADRRSWNAFTQFLAEIHEGVGAGV